MASPQNLERTRLGALLIERQLISQEELDRAIATPNGIAVAPGGAIYLADGGSSSITGATLRSTSVRMSGTER